MLDILIALGAGLGGAACGWLMRASVAKQGDPADADDAVLPHDIVTPKDELSQKSVYDVAEKLRTLSMRIAADVNEHQSRVQQVNLALTDGGTIPDSEAIVGVVTQLIQSNQTMQNQLQEAQQRIQDQAAQIQTAEERAVTDALTRIRNRRAFDDFLEKCYTDRHNSPTTLMLLDVDHFKNFNDSFGHLAGDEVLRNVAGMLEARLGEMGLVARYGGEEFAVIFDDCDMKSCQGTVELARQMIGEREIMFEGKRLSVTASLGLAEVDANESLEEWVDRVDRGLYKAKEMGRNRGYCMDGDVPIPMLEAGPGRDDSAAGKHAATQESTDVSLAKKAGIDGEQAERLLSQAWSNQARHLHDRKSMKAVFAQMKERLKVIEVGLYVVLVRSDRIDPGPAHLRDVLMSIYATTRALGQIGALENGDFVICMPGANEHAALQRAIAIRDAVEKSSQSGAEPATVSIGLGLVRFDDSFESMLEISRSAAEEAAAKGGGRVVIGQNVAVVTNH